MKTVERENRNRWAAAMLSIRADGTAGQNRPCSSTWGWKQEKLQRWEKYFLLTSPSIERSMQPLLRAATVIFAGTGVVARPAAVSVRCDRRAHLNAVAAHWHVRRRSFDIVD